MAAEFVGTHVASTGRGKRWAFGRRPPAVGTLRKWPSNAKRGGQTSTPPRRPTHKTKNRLCVRPYNPCTSANRHEYFIGPPASVFESFSVYVILKVPEIRPQFPVQSCLR